MRKLLIFIYIMSSSFLLVAQEEAPDTPISLQKFYMRDGSRLVGHIIEAADQGLWVAINQGADVYLAYADLLRMKPLLKIPVSSGSQPSYRQEVESPLFFKELSIGFLTGTPLYNHMGTMYDEPPFRLTVHGVVGKRINDAIGLGVGLGADGYETFRHFPLYAHGRYRLSSGVFQPFFSMNVGYSVASANSTGENFHQELSGGAYLAPAFTFAWQLPHAALHIGFKYSMQHYQSTITNYFGPMPGWSSFWPTQPMRIEESRFARRFALTIGLSF